MLVMNPQNLDSPRSKFQNIRYDFYRAAVQFGLRQFCRFFRLDLVVKSWVNRKRCRTLFSSDVFVLFLFMLLACLGGEAAGLGVSSLPASTSHLGRQVHC